MAALVTGLLCAHLIYLSIPCRATLGVFFGRGRLLALVHGAGIYEIDVERHVQEGTDSGADRTESDPTVVRRSVLSQLVANAEIEYLAHQVEVSPSSVDHQYDLLRYQIRPEQKWLAVLSANRFSRRWLRARLQKEVQALKWIEQRIVAEIETSPGERLRYYTAHLHNSAQPVRFRASHLFLAAPAGTAADVVQAKADLIQTLSRSIAEGGKFTDLVSSNSEDESSKGRGGDLNYFSVKRMPPDFYLTVWNLRVGDFTPVVRTKLGFHIIQLTDMRLAGGMTFEQSESEIRLALENSKRQAAISALQVKLCGKAEFLASPSL